MILARSTSVYGFYMPIGANITRLDFEVYQGTELIYSGYKLNYTPTLNVIEFDYSIFARDFINPRFPMDVTGLVADDSLYTTLGFAFEFTNGTDTLGGLGYENILVTYNFVNGYFDNLTLIQPNIYTPINYSVIGNISQEFILMNEGSYTYPIGANAGGIAVDTLGSSGLVTYTSPTGAEQSIIIEDVFGLIPCVHPSFQSVGNTVTIGEKTFNYTPTTECKYTPIKVDFINNLGGWQRFWLYKASSEVVTQKNEKFTRGFGLHRYIDGDSPTKVFNVETSKAIKGNSGWVEEEFNRTTLEPLMNSETIFIDDKPAILKTQSIELVKHINEKLINYTLEFDYAFNTIYK